MIQRGRYYNTMKHGLRSARKDYYNETIPKPTPYYPHGGYCCWAITLLACWRIWQHPMAIGWPWHMRICLRLG